MRVVISILVLIALAFVLLIFALAVKKLAAHRKERLALIHENRMLRNVVSLTDREIEVQEAAGYSDVKAFRHLINDYKELK